jgi:uncharacterized protein DUF6962
LTRTDLASLGTERTTAVTDALLALAVGAGVLRLRHSVPPSWRRRVWLSALAAFGVSALLGAASHGLALEERVRDALWQPLFVLLCLAVALFVVGAVADWRGEDLGRTFLPFLLVLGAGCFIATRLTAGDFRVFLAFEAAGLAFALAVYAALATRGRPGAALVAAALAVSLAAGAVQASGPLSVRLGWEFDHNGLYHLVQLVGVGLLIRGLATTLQNPPP